MAQQERVTPRKSERQPEPVVNETTGEAQTKADKLKADLDDIMDEIEGVLEENAEELVKGYVQRGGE